MKIKAPGLPSMTSAIAIGAGLAAALLYVVARQPGFVAFVMAQLGPLPIMIAALGFGGFVGLAAAVIGSLTVIVLALVAQAQVASVTSLGSAALDGLFFALMQGLPAWWLGRVVTMTRSPANDTQDIPNLGANGSPKYYPLGRVLVYAVAICVAAISFVIIANCIESGSYEAATAKLSEKIEPLVVTLVGSDRELFGNLDVRALSHLVARAAWPAVAAATLLMMMGNLWLAGRVVQLSHLLRRPWPNIPADLRAPRVLALVFVAALGVCFAGGLVGAIATVAAAVIGVAFALQGLAVVHDLTRGASYRVPLLCAIYLLLTVTMPWPLALFTLIGLAEAGFSLRDRKAAAIRKPEASRKT